MRWFGRLAKRAKESLGNFNFWGWSIVKKAADLRVDAILWELEEVPQMTLVWVH